MARKVSYRFSFADGQSWRYEFAFDEAHRYRAPAPTTPRPWTKLDFHQCSHCPLQKESSPHCPVALNLDAVVEDSKATVSHTQATVTVSTPERTYTKQCATQEGIRSLFGLLMASSGCPHLDWLRPLARFHLPFADPDENLFRILSLQCVENFLVASSSSISPDQRIAERYKAVEIVNHAFIERIRSHCEKDADKNAIATLDAFVQLFSYQLEANFSSLRKLFPMKAT